MLEPVDLSGIRSVPGSNECKYNVSTENKLILPVVSKAKNSEFSQRGLNIYTSLKFAPSSMKFEKQYQMSPSIDTHENRNDSFDSTSIFTKHLFSEDTTENMFRGAQNIRPQMGVGPIISDEFVSKPSQNQAKYPIIAYKELKVSASQTKHNYCDDLSDDELERGRMAIGDWTSPVVKEALARQVSKELQFRTLWANILRLLTAHFLLVFIAKATQIYCVNNELMGATPQNMMLFSKIPREYIQFAEILVVKAHRYAHRLLWLLVLVIIYNVVMVLWPQDQCQDLPLTSRQRELIGLKVSASLATEGGFDMNDLGFFEKPSEDDSAKSLEIPKYPHANKFSGIIKKRHDRLEDNAIGLRNVTPQRRLHRVS